MKTAAKNLSMPIDPEWSSGEADQFRQLALRYTEIGANEGIRVLPFTAPEMPLFQKL